MKKKTKQPKYEEQYQTCIFFARFFYYATLGGMDDPKYAEWEDFIWTLDRKAPGFIGTGSHKKPTFLGRALNKILPYSYLYKLPFVGNYWTTNSRKAYQIWSKAFDELGLTSEEMKRIIDGNINGPCGPEWVSFGETAWRHILCEREYVPFVSEIKWIYNKLRYGMWFVTKL